MIDKSTSTLTIPPMRRLILPVFLGLQLLAIAAPEAEKPADAPKKEKDAEVPKPIDPPVVREFSVTIDGKKDPLQDDHWQNPAQGRRGKATCRDFLREL